MFDEIEEDCWFDPEWLKANQLDLNTVTDYFKLSPFYQVTSLLESKLTLKIKIEACNGPNFIISKNLEDDNNKTHLIGLYRIFDYKIFKGINPKQYVQNQISSMEANIEEILNDIRKQCCWTDLKKKWELESDVKEEKSITLKEDFY